MLEGAEPRADAEATLDESPSGIATTAARALSLGARLSGSRALQGLDDELAVIGVRVLPRVPESAEDRQQIAEASESALIASGVDTWGLGMRVFEESEPPAGPPSIWLRQDLWSQLAESGSAVEAVSWLRLLMGDDEPIAAAAAASALSDFDAVPGDGQAGLGEQARTVLRRSLTSNVEEARQIALATPVIQADDLDAAEWSDLSFGGTDPRRPGDHPSLVIHGTFAWRGDWWYPGGDFHSYLKSTLRPDLYSGGKAFSWSGAYSDVSRGIAAKRLARWADDGSNGQLNTVFAHSYGGIIALMATTHGLRMNEVVLLSTPAASVDVEWRNVRRAVSLRIHLDLVLMAARRRQRFRNNVEENHLPMWFVNHADSHMPDVWDQHGCAARLGL